MWVLMFTKKQKPQGEVLSSQCFGCESISEHRGPSWSCSHLAQYRGLGALVAEKFADERDEAIIFEHDQCCLKTLMRN
jgi:hypothetical protein